MGNRLHYHKKHEIECAGGGFNWMQEEVYNLLSEFDCTVYADNTEDPCYADEFSVPFEDVEAMLEELSKRNPDDICFEDYTNKEVYDFFKEAYDNAPKTNSDIYFSWF